MSDPRLLHLFGFRFGGAGQQCCYDYQGFLMFTDDWEPTGDYTRSKPACVLR